MTDRTVIIPAPPDPAKIPMTDPFSIPIASGKGFAFPIPGLGQTFVVPSVPPFVGGWGGSTVKSPKRLKRRAEKKRKKLRRKQGRQ